MKKKIIITKIFSALSVILLIIALALFTFVIAARIKGEIPGVFGYTFHVVVTDSMTPEIKVNDLVVAKKAGLSDVRIGDDVVFVSPDPDLNGMTIVHKVVAVNRDGSLSTQGVKEGATVDRYPVTEIKGKVVAVSTFFGKIFSGMTKNRNLVFGAALLILIAIIAEEIVRISIEVYKNKNNKKTDTKPGNDQKLSK